MKVTVKYFGTFLVKSAGQIIFFEFKKAKGNEKYTDLGINSSYYFSLQASCADGFVSVLQTIDEECSRLCLKRKDHQSLFTKTDPDSLQVGRIRHSYSMLE